ncbi:DUF3231 family protein [Desulfoscipio sp. XC116]|uniref:DUF3231 family protein n=1 Tax=Desulfoscipio sp. XC116 TaxID=3144975 RepID=UPI00325A8177
MVQLFNFHIGRADKAETPILNAGEAFILWNDLVTRYDNIEKTQLYQNLIHDPDFKYLVAKKLGDTLEQQANELEHLMDMYKLPLPCRPPKSTSIQVNSELMNDRYLFRDIMAGVENLMTTLTHSVRTFTTNDAIRGIAIKNLSKEIEIYDDMCKFGKLKGWLTPPPLK